MGSNMTAEWRLNFAWEWQLMRRQLRRTGKDLSKIIIVSEDKEDADIDYKKEMV